MLMTFIEGSKTKLPKRDKDFSHELSVGHIVLLDCKNLLVLAWNHIFHIFSAISSVVNKAIHGVIRVHQIEREMVIN